MKLRIKRVYDPPSPDDGVRILVDRLWPRGLKQAEARIDHWAKDVAPSHEIRRWYRHDPAKWPEFQDRYFEELADRRAALEAMLRQGNGAVLTLLFAARTTDTNNAAALKGFLETDPAYSDRFRC